MKKTFYLFVFILLSSCSENENRDSEISIKSDHIEYVVVRNPEEGVYIWDMKNDTIYANENKEFIFKKEIEIPEYIVIKVGEESLKSILLPNSKIEVEYTDSSYVFKGNNSAGMEFLNKIKRPYFDVSEFNKYQTDSTPYQITNKIKVQQDDELNEIQKLVDNNQIDERFENILKEDINYFYASRTIQIILSKQHQNFPINKDLLELSNTIEKKYPLNIDYKPSSWLDLADNILLQKPLYKLLANNSITIDSVQTWYKNDQWIPYQYNVINEYENSKIAEIVTANFLMNTTKQNNFEKSLIKVFKNFKERYPTSPYTKYLSPEIQKVEDYHEKISGNLADNIQFIDGKDVATMTALLNILKGDKYYVDVWATWCAPCKREFKFNEDLDVLLKANGYKKLYISLDKPEVENKWKDDIKYYNLSGLHMLASLDFFQNFEQNYSLVKGYLSIPQYLIIDENGNILTNNAPRPSNLTELEKVLTK